MMKIVKATGVAFLLFASGEAALGWESRETLQWQPTEIRLAAEKAHSWWSFPVEAEFVHEETEQRLKLEGYWDGGKEWVIRFAPPRAGLWSYKTVSQDAGLGGREGTIVAATASEKQLAANPNLRGHLKSSANGRYFVLADGTPFFLLADTLWAGNTLRCGLGENRDGPFFKYLEDRKAKGFTAVLMKYLNGFDDNANNPKGDRNEGGYPFRDLEFEQLNAAYFQALDARMAAIWEHGMAAANPAAWWGKTKKCFFDIEWAKRISAYCAVRYGAFNALWCLSGEYQYTLKDCGWTAEDLNQLGAVVQRHNPYRHPLSIHPSGQTKWPPPHNAQSSRAFHESEWLDHHWLQTGQSENRMFNIVQRVEENRALRPVRPVFCSEAYYDHTANPDLAYHARWQAWTAFLSGAAGYGYGAQGVWQFLDPSDPKGETGVPGKNSLPWKEAMQFEGSRQMGPLRGLLTRYEWWKLEPRREMLLIDASKNRNPTATDLTPPHCATVPGRLAIIYVPRGNEGRVIKFAQPLRGNFKAEWHDPRNGSSIEITNPPTDEKEWTIPQRPKPSNEDWILTLEPRR